MRYHITAAILTLALVLPQTVLAKNGNGKGGDKSKGAEKSADIRIRKSFAASNPLHVDLAALRGSLDYRLKKGQTQFKVDLRLPILSPSIGISDAATAAASPIKLEFLRDGVVYNECTFRFHSPREGEVSNNFHFSMQGKGRVKGKGKNKAKMIKGSCTQGIPAMQRDDSVVGHALVAGARVDFLSFKP